jgi:hypothetical protein
VLLSVKCALTSGAKGERPSAARDRREVAAPVSRGKVPGKLQLERPLGAWWEEHGMRFINVE